MYDALGVDAQRIPLMQMVVQHRRKQVVGGGDGVKVAREMQVDLVHRHDLRIPAARRAALDAEHRPERRLAQRDDRLFADAGHRLSQPDGGGRFALAGRRGGDGGDEDELGVAVGGQTLERLACDFGLVFAVRLKLVRRQSQTGGDFHNRLFDGLGGDFHIAFECFCTHRG